MAIKDKDQIGTGLRPLLVDATGLHSSPGNNSLTTGSYTLDATYGDMFCDCSGGVIALTFPAASAANAGKRYRAFKTDSSTNTLTVNGVVLGGNLGLWVIDWEPDSAWKLVSLYDEGTYTASLTGCTTVPTGTVSYVRNGKAVTLRSTAITGTSNTTAMTMTGMPAHLYPAIASLVVVSNVADNGADHLGFLSLSTAGVFTASMYTAATVKTSTFTNAGTKGVTDFVMGYVSA